MADNDLNNNEQVENDIEIAELASREIRARDEQIAQLKKDLARAKLYSSAEEDDVQPIMTREECIKKLQDPNTCNYDYAEAVITLVEQEESAGRPSPLGEDSQKVCEFFEECIERCDGDKSKFTAVYQSMIAPDDARVALRGRKQK